MIPSDHFVRFYNEVFKFLDEKNGLDEYYRQISCHQELHCLELFREKGAEIFRSCAKLHFKTYRELTGEVC